MRLLVTRPLPDGKGTASRLEAMGHSVLLDPLLRLEVLPRGQVPFPAAIVATSRNGVRAMATWPEISSWFGLPFFAVGSATAAEAEKTGFTDIRVAAGDGSALASLIAQSMQPGVDAIIYAAGGGSQSGAGVDASPDWIPSRCRRRLPDGRGKGAP